MAASESDLQGQEIAAIVREIRDRVHARYPDGQPRGIGVALPDLMPLLHARDAAAAKVAAIGTVNPRPPGLVNNLIQSVKRGAARALGWFVRDQVEFNRAVLTALDATLEALNEANRALSTAGGEIDDFRTESRNFRDFRAFFAHFRDESERKLLQNEVHFLKSVSELQAAFDLRLTGMDANYRESLRQQHAEFTTELQRSLDDLQKRFWADLERVRMEYERLIHTELRVVRQKAFSAPAEIPTDAPRRHPHVSPLFDYARFAERFRGSEEYVRERQQFYVPFFSGRRNVLDIGCGRGEFLDLMRQAGVAARGLDLDEESVALCRSKGLNADVADAFDFLHREPDAAFDGIFAAQVIERMAPEELPRLVKLCAAKLRRGGILVLETPNPECLAIFARHFYLDPTHQRPIPPALLRFYLEEFGFGGIEVHRLSPAADTMPAVRELPEGFREAFFGALDYGIIGRRL